MTQVLTVFRSRLRREAQAAYAEEAGRIEALARSMPGFVELKQFVAADGERVSLVTFADRRSHDAWRDHPEHRKAQERGRTEFYESYRIQVCEPAADWSFPSAHAVPRSVS